MYQINRFLLCLFLLVSNTLASTIDCNNDPFKSIKASVVKARGKVHPSDTLHNQMILSKDHVAFLNQFDINIRTSILGDLDLSLDDKISKFEYFTKKAFRDHTNTLKDHIDRLKDAESEREKALFEKYQKMQIAISNEIIKNIGIVFKDKVTKKNGRKILKLAEKAIDLHLLARPNLGEKQKADLYLDLLADLGKDVDFDLVAISGKKRGRDDDRDNDRDNDGDNDGDGRGVASEPIPPAPSGNPVRPSFKNPHKLKVIIQRGVY